MSKHAVRQFTPARLVLGFAALILVGLVGWVAIRSGGPASAGDEPLLVQPTSELQRVENLVLPSEPAWLTDASGSPSPSPSPSASVASSAPASASPSASRTSSSPSPSAVVSTQPGSSPTPSKATRTPGASPAPTRPTSAPEPVNDLAATYSTTAVWRDGFIASVRVVNNGDSTRDFAVTMNYPSGSDVEARGGWNASVSGSGGRITVSGTVRAGASIVAGFQAEKDSDASVRSVTCSVGGGTCRVG